MTALRLSPDGQWLAAVVATLAADKKKYVSSIWRIDAQSGAAQRLTRSADGESDPAFLPDGSLLFLSSRPDTTAKPADDEAGRCDKAALWSLPAGEGEARRVAAPPGGVAKAVTARNATSFLVSAPVFEGTKDEAEDVAKRKARADAGVSAILHTGDRVRFWDADLGPERLRLLAGQVGADGEDDETASLSDLTPDAGRALDEQSFCLSPDGSLAITGWQVTDGPGDTRTELAVVDVATGQRRRLMSAEGYDFEEPVISPDGTLVAAIRSEHGSYERPGDVTIVIVPLAGGAGQARDLLPGFDRRPETAVFSADSGTIYFTADDNGRCPIFAVAVATGQVRQITTDDGAYDNLCSGPDGQVLYGLRSAITEPPTAVRIDVSDVAADPVRLPGPLPRLEVPGQVREVSATVADGRTVRGWLVLPQGATAQAKAPLLLWVHGGPVSSWNSWSWRWNPWLMAARGYAVLLPDPALSTGYGHDFIARGYGSWGEAPFTDVMMITDVATALPEIDASRTAMMGGSFGGYMANWIAGHTDRFGAIVSHAGLWALDQMFGTTDGPSYWRREFGHPETKPERYVANSPHLHAAAVKTPILIIHGDKDYRVPVGEALRMYSDLVGRGQQVKFLYFPDENHWILKPGDAAVWYETVLAFLAEYVLGEQWQRPQML
ncbi:MAG TPA: S9 family peptidase [Streptosporangiaceae bacterium]|nr:S9 family peptidase [Streptosporangiaceae bacterium]